MVLHYIFAFVTGYTWFSGSPGKNGGVGTECTSQKNPEGKSGVRQQCIWVNDFELLHKSKLIYQESYKNITDTLTPSSITNYQDAWYLLYHSIMAKKKNKASTKHITEIDLDSRVDESQRAILKCVSR